MNGDQRRLFELDRQLQLLEHAKAVLGWDQETYMPAAAVGERAEQLSLLQGLIHDRLVDPELGDLLDAAQEQSLARFLRRRREREMRLSRDLVMRLARTTSMAQAAWAEARSVSSFEVFRPHLTEIVSLNREVADSVGYAEHPYDALLDEYEPWMKSAAIGEIFDALEKRLVPLVSSIRSLPQPDAAFLNRPCEPALQEAFSRELLAELGFDFDRGRLDVSAHPFTATLGGDDVRVTTRYNRGYFPAGLFGTIHEFGHALYEQGFAPELRGTSLGAGASLGLHESQSRLWENMIGRSLHFWKRFYPLLCKRLPGCLDDIAVEDFHRAVNRVNPSLIRVDADEVTYNLHIILRFRLELELISGSLEAADVPDAWNEGSEALLGLRPEREADGVLQDIHWALGAMGYFPTYTLGNLYAAQFMRRLRADLADVDALIERGDFSPLLEWLRTNIHRSGCTHTAEEICVQLTGRPLTIEPFIDYLGEKYGALYGL